MTALARVKRAAAKRSAASKEYRAAVRAARDEGHSFRVIAAAAGVSHVAVLKLLKD